MVRAILQQVTGVWTGSDFTHGPLKKRGMVGEGTRNYKVQVIKTHYPETGGPTINISKAILLVRNPLKAAHSYWHLMLTNDHCTTAPASGTL